MRIAAGGETLPRQIVLAGAPVAFADFLRQTAWRLHGRRPLLVPLPSAPLLRVLGLVGLTVQSGAEDAARLGLSLRPLATGLSADAGRRRRGRAGEAAAYLRYVLGRPASPATLRRYLRGWRRYDFGATIVPAWLQKCPPLLPRAIIGHWLWR